VYHLGLDSGPATPALSQIQPPHTHIGTTTIMQEIAITKTKCDANKIKIRKRV
jgi:hypothetical protein